jgi:hypothetical protein
MLAFRASSRARLLLPLVLCFLVYAKDRDGGCVVFVLACN